MKTFFNRYSDGVELGDKEALIKKLGSVGIEYVGDLEELVEDGDQISVDNSVIEDLKDLVVSKMTELNREKEREERTKERKAREREAVEFRISHSGM